MVGWRMENSVWGVEEWRILKWLDMEINVPVGGSFQRSEVRIAQVKGKD